MVVYCSAGTLRENKWSLPCSLSPLDNHVIEKDYSRNITDRATSVDSEKEQRISYQAFISRLTFIPRQ